jgi:YggT family protein
VELPLAATVHLDSYLGLQPLLYELSALDPATAATAATVLGPLLSVGELLFIVRRAHSVFPTVRLMEHRRIVMTWYPNIKDNEFPWSIVYLPTEPLLGPTRKLIEPVG